jgi:hypothetical protein
MYTEQREPPLKKENLNVAVLSADALLGWG